MTGLVVSDKPIKAPEEAITYVDDAIKRRLPRGTVVRAISPSGPSCWSRTARIEATDEHGAEVNYFVKVVNGDTGREQAFSEHATMAMLHNAAPELVPRVIGSGPYDSLPGTYFILHEYHGFQHGVYPAPVCERYNFARMVATMHERSRWPGHKFGTDMPVYCGNVRCHFPMTDSWERTFREGMRGLWALEMEAQGWDDELSFLESMMLEKVIPRLLGPLQADGRMLVPSLVHGDLWEGNAGLDRQTGTPKIFDATPMWAPAEYELGPLRPQRRRKFGAPMLAEYEKRSKYPEPEHEAHDRLDLYSLRFDAVSSILYKGKTILREAMRQNMRKLWAKFGEGFEAWAGRQERLRAVQQRSQGAEWKDEMVARPGAEPDDDSESVGDLEECA